MSSELKTNLAEVERFLRWAHPEGPWVLTAIPVEGGRTTTETFFDMRAALGWVAQFSGKQNIYWTVNRVRGAIDKKPKKEDIEEAVMLHVDLDPRKGEDVASEQARILALLEDFSPSPSAIIFSGGGYQAFWRLDEPLYIGGTPERWTDLEAYNRQLGIVMGGDNTWNVDRIMRLPGTINIPDEKKRKKGRVERVAEVISLSDITYPLHDFTAAPELPGGPGVQRAEVVLGEVRRLQDLDELPAGVSQRIRAVIVEGRDADPERYPSRSEAVCAVTRELVRAGCEDDMIAAVLLDPDFGVSKSILEHGAKAKAEAAREIANARDDVGEIRPRVVYDENVLPRVVDAAETALLASGIPLYQMTGRLVQPVRLDDSSSDDQQVRRDAGALIIHDLNEHRLLEHMIAAADFVKQTRNAKGDLVEKPYAPPLKFAKHYAERVGAWRLPVLAGISTIPTMRPDGSVVSADGYDPRSRLIVDTQGVVFPAVPDQPTRDSALAALEALVYPISEFPFVQDDEDDEPCGERPSTSRSAALAMLLTAVARPALRSAPIFGLSAPTMETGKSLLADVAAMMVTGRWATKMSQGATEEEDEKRLLSVLMKGDPVNVIDNIAREVSGDALCSILTEERWSGRWLGQSRMVEVSTRALFIANGNNLVFREDMAVRAVMVSLDAQMERPGERVFQRDLKEYVPRHRAELVTAALTILRGYVVAGRPMPAGMKPSRFADWDMIRGALLWLGEPDPWATQTRVTAGDSARAELVALMTAVRDAFGAGEFVSTGDIIARADEEYQMDQRPGPLGLALSAACSGRSGVTAVGLGKYLKSKRDRRHEGMWIRAHEDAKNGNRYAVMAEVPRPAQGALL